jgi:S-adenosylmethionine:tRNA ribosyltransferase-isomerase
VVRARLRGRKATGGQVEVFLLRERGPGEWECLVRPGAKVKPGTRILFDAGIEAEAGAVLPGGRRRVRFDETDVIGVMQRIGAVPLPPYLEREADASDLTRYQTVYAKAHGAVAAPTAGLHYTEAVFDALEATGVGRAWLTLHVGYGTFRPIQGETLDAHELEAEVFSLPADTADRLDATRAGGGRVVAVGTTVTRVLETQWHDGAYQPGEGETRAYIYPPYTFRGVDVLQTNFHLPRSSLLALVCAFGGTDLILEAYRYAVDRRFRFYSYGDTMLVL